MWSISQPATYSSDSLTYSWLAPSSRHLLKVLTATTAADLGRIASIHMILRLKPFLQRLFFTEVFWKRSQLWDEYYKILQKEDRAHYDPLVHCISYWNNIWRRFQQNATNKS